MYSKKEVEEVLIQAIKDNLLDIDIYETNEALRLGQSIKFTTELHKNENGEIECFSFEFGN